MNPSSVSLGICPRKSRSPLQLPTLEVHDIIDMVILRKCVTQLGNEPACDGLSTKVDTGCEAEEIAGLIQCKAAQRGTHIYVMRVFQNPSNNLCFSLCTIDCI